MSIPSAVSPVMIDVEVDGKQFQEMHVDGGVLTQVFLYPPGTVMALNSVTGARTRQGRHFYVIRNGKLVPQWSGTKRRTLSIGGRAISALIQTGDQRSGPDLPNCAAGRGRLQPGVHRRRFSLSAQSEV